MNYIYKIYFLSVILLSKIKPGIIRSDKTILGKTFFTISILLLYTMEVFDTIFTLTFFLRTKTHESLSLCNKNTMP